MKQLDRRKPTFKGWLEFAITEKKASFIACIKVNLQLTRVSKYRQLEPDMCSIPPRIINC